MYAQTFSSLHANPLGRNLETSVSLPQVNNPVVLSIEPGAKRKELHRDDMIITMCCHR
ncbi:hypothetical protein F5884DRAFT_786764 [Xylogone sp. PMI_703]|nr:hypothetical protein F5884DRAFT_786764 [Xylogone sp. PMI_703]